MIEFQSTHPVRDATARASSFRSPRPDFNPRTSQTPTGSRRFQSTRPVWGATGTACLPASASADFNPRAPCGARHPAPYDKTAGSGFQSTRPVWGATPAASAARDDAVFQSTRPVWGATTSLPAIPRGTTFQSTRPVGARQDLPAVLKPVAAISIHAPHGRGGVSAGRPAGRCSHRP